MSRKVVFIIAASALLIGCAGPPKLQKVDSSTIPVKSGTVPSTKGSIWPGENSRNALFQDLRAKNVGDVVTVQITEKTSAIKEASTSTSRQSNTDIGIQQFLGMPLNFGMRNFLNQGNPFSPEVQASYDATFDGSGTTKRSGELSAVIATRVTEVMGNGNLVLEGRKEILVNNEHQFIILSGIARPEDINEQNVIPSILLSDARIEYNGKGVISDEQSPGWMRRVLDNVWPF
ncbi:MAG: flagellar basal body L-ring protein FlgH [Deltaproteobacteria bacterium]|nr:flagellar basal body L-ring protein FlgH [Deltaproteobacteria bacterium]